MVVVELVLSLGGVTIAPLVPGLIFASFALSVPITVVTTAPTII